jgi:hypothetical protein
MFLVPATMGSVSLEVQVIDWGIICYSFAKVKQDSHSLKRCAGGMA